jgi:hypothetical protein
MSLSKRERLRRRYEWCKYDASLSRKTAYQRHLKKRQEITWHIVLSEANRWIITGECSLCVKEKMCIGCWYEMKSWLDRGFPLVMGPPPPIMAEPEEVPVPTFKRC